MSYTTTPQEERELDAMFAEDCEQRSIHGSHNDERLWFAQVASQEEIDWFMGRYYATPLSSPSTA